MDNNNIANFVVDLIFKPGTSLLLVPVINVAIILLLCVLVFLLYTKINPIHIIVMGTLSVGLLLSVNWVYYEVQNSKQNDVDSTGVNSNEQEKTKNENSKKVN